VSTGQKIFYTTTGRPNKNVGPY